MAMTMKEIARLAGVSQPAVSAVINGSDTIKVSEERREKILELIREYNYTPNNAAQRLKGRASHTIGVFGVPFISEISQAQMLAASLELEKRGYNLISCYGDAGTEKNAIRALTAKGVDGIIVTTLNCPMERCKVNIPYVHVPPCGYGSFDVAVDHRAGFCEMASSLIGQGCRRIAFLGIGNLDNLEPGKPDFTKYDGVCDALKQNGLPVLPELRFSYAAADYEEEKLLQMIKTAAPDAICCANDYLASKLILFLQSRKIRVPEDIKVTGYDGLSLVNLISPAVATSAQPIFETVQFAIDLLMRRIETKEEYVPEKKLFAPEFYPNRSCGFIPEHDGKLPLHDTYSMIEFDLMFNRR